VKSDSASRANVLRWRLYFGLDRNDAGARPWDRRRPLIVGEAARQRAHGIVRFKTSPWSEAGPFIEGCGHESIRYKS
jgi:hypothetical protein